MYILTPAEDLANQVEYEFAKLKRAGVEKVDFSQLISNVIRANGINDPVSFKSLRSGIAKVFAQRRAQKKAKNPGHNKKASVKQKSFRFRAIKIG